MDSEDSDRDTPCVSNLPSSATTALHVPSGFLSSTSSAWTSRAGVVLDFHPPPVLNSKNSDRAAAGMQAAAESRLAFAPGQDVAKAMAAGQRDTTNHGHARGPDSRNPKLNNGPVQTDTRHGLRNKDTSSDNNALPGALSYGREISGHNSASELDGNKGAFEHQTAREQAKLLQRYKQLKQLQKEQQEKLLRKQFEELEQLKSVQERVNNEIALQRQIQWGGSGSGPQPTTGEVSSRRPPPSAASTPSLKPSTIPQILANAAIKSSASGDSVAQQQTHQDQPPKQLIKPFIPQPSLPLEHEPNAYDSELDSASDVPSSTMIEGVEPLPDTASELSDLPGEDRHSRPQPVVAMETIADSEERKEKTLDETEEDVSISQSPITNFDDLPVTSCIGARVKTFEELLEEKLQLEEATGAYSPSPDHLPTSRKPFLRKGHGIARFGMGKEPSKKTKASPGQKPISGKLHSGKPERSGSSSERQKPKTRNEKPSSPTRKSRNISPKVSRKVAAKTASDTDGVFKHPLPMTLKLNPQGGKPRKPAAVTVTKEDRKAVPENPDSTMEISFQNRMKELELRAETEQQELEEFELLERAADNVSFSSNSSMVARLINKQKPTTKASTIEEIVDQDDGREDSLQEKTLGEDESDASPNVTKDDGDSPTEDEEDDNDDDENDDNDRTLEAKREVNSAGRETNHIDFNDDESWGDFSQDVKDSEEEEEEDESEEEGSSDHDDRKDDESIIAGSVPLVTSTPPVRKLASHDSKSVITKETLKDQSSTPPTSLLMTKLFPQLKPVVPKETDKQQQQQQQRQLQGANERPLGDGVQSKLLKDKLAELETEIERFRAENAMLLKLREDREKAMKGLQKEMKDFEKYKNDELQRLEELKEEQMKKLKKEKKTFEKYQKAARAMPDKKEREEIDFLKQQVSELQEEMHRKEARWTSSSTRLRNKVEALEKENQEVKDEIQVLEKRRLDAWKRDSSSRGKEKPSKKSTSREKHQDTPRKDNNSPGKVNDAEHTKSTSPNVKKTDERTTVSDRRRVEEYDGDTSQRLLYEASLPEDTPRKQPPVTSPTKQSQLTTTTKIHPEASEFEGYNGEAAGNLPRRRVQRKRAIKFEGSGDADQGYGLKPSPSGRTENEDGDDVEEIVHPDGKVECLYPSGRRVITFTNGTRKEISQDGQTIIVSFFNGDIKQIMPDQRVIYYYAEAKTTHTTYPDGLEVLQFPNNQIEKHYPDGTKEITFPDHTIKYLFPNGSEESIFPDGTVLRVDKNGERTMEFPNGQREVHTPQYKKREYPDGTVKTVYPDGRQETRYSNGRIRVKDKEGRIIVDRVC